MEETNSQHLHFKIFKPYGYLSQFTNNDVSKHKKKLLGELYEFPENIMAIGRLDEKSEGLLLLTTDGKISDLINYFFKKKITKNVNTFTQKLFFKFDNLKTKYFGKSSKISNFNKLIN